MAGSSTEAAAHSRRVQGTDGAHVQLKAGDATSSKSTGGNIMLFAGHGLSNDRWDGGNGGSIELIAGRGHGRDKDLDTGGDVSITGGASTSSSGGSLVIKSGPSLDSSSGNVTIASDDSAKLGVSGSINISTGLGNWGNSGEISLSTGASQKHGHGGSIHLEVGHTADGNGGNATIIAGSSSAMFCKFAFAVLLFDCVHPSTYYSRTCFLQHRAVLSLFKEARGGTTPSTTELMVGLF